MLWGGLQMGILSSLPAWAIEFCTEREEPRAGSRVRNVEMASSEPQAGL